MPTMFNPAVRESLQERLALLTPDRRPQWGQFTAPKMVGHLIEGMKMTYGDIVIPQKKMFIGYPGVRDLLIYVLPWPHGTPTAPQLLTHVPVSWDSDLAELRAQIDRFAKQTPDGQWAVHPAFGALSGRQWGALAYKHIDHHFRQFAI